MSTALFLALIVSELSCPPCREADLHLGVGDTASAVAVLEHSGGANPEVEGQLAFLGVLALPVGPEGPERVRRLSSALERALQATPNDPRWYLGLGVLQRKTGAATDAVRLLDRALKLSEEASAPLNKSELAVVHSELGGILQDRVLDFEDFVPNAEDIPFVDLECSSAFCLNFSRPAYFNDRLLSKPLGTGLVEDERKRMRAHYDLALGLAPENVRAARGLMAEAARLGDWGRVGEIAGVHAEARPADPWALLFIVLGHLRSGDPAAAEAALDSALTLLSAEEKASVFDIGPLTPREQLKRLEAAGDATRERSRSFRWRFADPLFSTPYNERRLEHVARVALAELWFGDPERDRMGYLTEPGEVLVRYGEPKWVRQIQRGDAQLRNLILEGGSAHAAGGGRWIFWTYDRRAPSFVFEKQLGNRPIHHALASSSRAVFEELAALRPSTFDFPPSPALPYQVVRFRGSATAVEADVIVGIPAPPNELEGAVAMNLFVIPLDSAEVQPITRELRGAELDVRSLTFRLSLEVGQYPFAVEALASDSLIGASRGIVQATPFPEGTLSISDVLLAHQINPAKAPLRSRRDFAIQASASARFAQGEDVAVYFEIYELQADESGMAAYRVELKTTDAAGNLIDRITARLPEFLGGRERDLRLSWQRELEGTAAVPEWFTLQVPELQPGTYELEVAITDVVTGSVARRTTRFTIGGPER